MKITDRREVRVSAGDKVFTFVAEPENGRLLIRQEGDTKSAGAVTVAHGEELTAFLEGLSRALGGEGSIARVAAAEPSSAESDPGPPSPALRDPEVVARARRRNPNAFKPWTPEEDRRLADGISAGQSVEELADALARSRRAVRIRLQKLREDGAS